MKKKATPVHSSDLSGDPHEVARILIFEAYGDFDAAKRYAQKIAYRDGPLSAIYSAAAGIIQAQKENHHATKS